MAEFASSGVTNATPNILANIPAAIAQGQGLQANALANMGTQQALTNQQTFRDNTAGLLAKDPTATAAALGANPQATVTYLDALPQMDQNTRAQTLYELGLKSSLAGSVLAQPADQRQAAWTAARGQLASYGIKNLPSEIYPGDNTLHTFRGMALTAEQQFGQQAGMLSTAPVVPMQATPGGGYVGPGGAPAPSQAAPGNTYPGAITQNESGGNPNAQNPMPGQTAAGADGFTDGTWLQTVKTAAPQLAQGKTDAQLLAMRSDPTLSGQMTNAYAQQNAPILTAAGFKPTSTNLALAHNFGPGGATRLLQADPNTPMATLFSPQVISVNPQLAKMTAGQVVQAASARMANVPSPVAPVQVASNAGAAGMPQTATDASPAGSTPGFATMLGGLYTPSPTSPSGQGSFSASGQPTAADIDTLIRNPSLAPAYDARFGKGASAGFVAPSGAAQSQSTTPTATPQSAVPAYPAQPQNALAGSPSSVAPQLNALAGASPSPVSTPQNALVPLSPQAAQSAFKPVYQGNHLVPIEGQPGYVLGIDAQGNRGAVRLPGAPGAGVDTHIEGGSVISTDKQTGQIVQNTPGAAPNTMRATPLNDGQKTTLYQGSTPVAQVDNKPNLAAINTEVYKEDRDDLGPTLKAGQDAQAAQVKTREMRDDFAVTPTGAGTPTKAALQDWIQSMFGEGAASRFASKVTGIDDLSALQVAKKLALTSAGMDERGVLGGHGSLGAIKLYQEANPGIELQPNAIKTITNMKLVSQQADADYAQAANQHVQQQRQNLVTNGSYEPLDNFAAKWQAGRPAQVYSAAMSALNGDSFEKWSKNLSPSEGQRVVGILTRADPGAPIQWKGGQTFHVPSGAPAQ